MAQNTPIAALPWPELTDIPNAQTAFQNLANAIDPLVIPRFASATARDAAITSPTDGQACARTDLHALQTYHGGIAAYAFPGWSLISRQVLGGSAATVSISSIPQEYQHLMVVVMARSTDTGNTRVNLNVNINSDSGGNYGVHTFRANEYGTTNAVDQGQSQTALNGGFCVITGSGAGISSASAGIATLFIPHYSGTTWNKLILTQTSAMDKATTSLIRFGAGVWQSSAAVTSLLFTPSSGTVQTGSVFSLYGMS